MEISGRRGRARGRNEQRRCDEGEAGSRQRHRKKQEETERCGTFRHSYGLAAPMHRSEFTASSFLHEGAVRYIVGSLWTATALFALATAYFRTLQHRREHRQTTAHQHTTTTTLGKYRRSERSKGATTAAAADHLLGVRRCRRVGGGARQQKEEPEHHQAPCFLVRFFFFSICLVWI